MNINEYVKKNQKIVDYWKVRFDCLFNWNIKFVYDGEHWSQSLYDIKNQQAILYPCEIEDEEAYILHEIIKLCFVATHNDMTKKLEFITDLTTLILK